MWTRGLGGSRPGREERAGRRGDGRRGEERRPTTPPREGERDGDGV